MRKQIKIAPSVQKTLYPLDWDRECTDKSFNEWREYIDQELHGRSSNIEKQMDKTLSEYKLILES